MRRTSPSGPRTQPVLVIAGMHRSGTSLMTSLLHSAGLFVGDRLMAAAESNPEGHFEDLDFYDLHQRALRASGLDVDGWVTDATGTMPPLLRDEAAAMIAVRRGRGIPWGWKDPRNTLFLEFWKSMVPDAHWLFMVRSPWDVVDSLFRRADLAIRDNPQAAVAIWAHYNRLVRDFVCANPGKCTVIDVAQLFADPVACVRRVAKAARLPLGGPRARVRPELLSPVASSHRIALVAKLVPGVLDLYSEMLSLAGADEPATVDVARRESLDAEGAAVLEWAASAEQLFLRRAAERRAAGLDADVATARAQVESERTRLQAELESERSRLQADLASERVQREVERQAAESARHAAESARQAAESQEDRIRSLTAFVEARDAALEAKEHELQQTAAAFHASEEVARARAEAIRALEQSIEVERQSMSQSLSATRDALQSRVEQLDTLRRIISNREDDIAALRQQAADAQAAHEAAMSASADRLKAADSEIIRLSGAHAESDRTVAALTQLLDQRWSELRGIYTSRIWRLMAPWREIATRVLGRPKTEAFRILGPDLLRALLGRPPIDPPPEGDPLIPEARSSHPAVLVHGSPPARDSGQVPDRDELWKLIAGGVRSAPHKAEASADGGADRTIQPKVKALAFLLPQFHPIPENDLWWGKGFTEWTNVVRARPNFMGHQQPQLPADLGFYDLRLPEAREAQAELARRYGIHGFCYYYYWFGGRRLLHRPLDEILKSGQPDFPYCICWANENWTRTWDGNARDVLLEAEHSTQDSLDFIRSLIPHFKDSRYIRVNGAPMLLVYRVDIVPGMAATAALWREECRRAGIPEIHLVSVQSFGIGDPRKYGCDAAVEFPPHGTDMAWNCNAAFADRMLNPAFSGHIVDVERVIDMSLRRTEPDYRLYRGIMPAWDNTARRQDNPLIFVNSTAERYEYWLSELVRRTAGHPDHADRFIFINAWNEWAEGAHLEPDQRSGHTYLEATRRALSGEQRFRSLPAATVAADGGGSVAPLMGDGRGSQSNTNLASGASGHPPARPLGRQKSVGESIYGAGRWIFRRMPGYEGSRAGAIDWLFRHTGGLFAQTAAHRDWVARQPRFVAQSSVVPLPRSPSDSDEDSPIVIPTSDAPRVSIVIPVFNNWSLTERCLRSIASTRPSAAFEVLVVDDCSTDATAGRLRSASGVRVLRNPSNLGFLNSCNAAVNDCRGEYIVFLNNDTEVLEGWLDELVRVADGDATVGLVGSMLVFPDGTLQEAGGIIFKDASGMNFGRGQHPHRPEFNYLREPDYCSGASILVSRELFEKLGRFDTRYSPAYYEDTDLAFRVREAGRRVVFNPLSRVIHHEGATSGTDTTKGVKAYQVENQSKFLSRWKHVLEHHGDREADLAFERERRAKLRALVIDVVTPLPDQDSGSVDTFSHLRVLLSLGFKVTFAPNSLAHHGKYTETLQRMGIECLYGPFVPSIAEFLQAEGHRFDLVIVKRIECAAEHIDNLRRYCTSAKIIFDTVDLHYMRELRRAEVEGSHELRRLALQTKQRELSVIRKSHATIVISDVERLELAKEVPGANVHVIPFIRDVIGSEAPFARRRDLVFVGGYLHVPNVDAVVHFCADVWPLVHARIPDARFRLIGSNMPPEVKALGSIPGVSPEGFVQDLGEVFNAVRLSVAPLRFGAGIKGKVASSLSYGVPCVMSPLAAEGMGIESGQSGLIASSPNEWADAIVRVYEDERLWDRLSEGGMRLLRNQYSWVRGVELWRAAIASVGVATSASCEGGCLASTESEGRG